MFGLPQFAMHLNQPLVRQSFKKKEKPPDYMKLFYLKFRNNLYLELIEVHVEIQVYSLEDI